MLLIEHYPALAERHLDALLAESWLIVRPDAISSMAKLDSTGLHSFEWKAHCGRWDRYLPADLPYTFEGRSSDVPQPDSWPVGVKRKLLEVFGPELNLPDLPRQWRTRNPVPLH